MQLATKHSLRYYYNGSAATVAKAPTLAATIGVLQELRAAGVNVLVGCTYMSTTVKILEALEAMDYSVLALSVSASVGTPSYIEKVRRCTI